MSDTHQWNITIPGAVIAIIDMVQSSFNPGPFPANTQQQIAEVYVENVGDMVGWLYLKCYQYPEGMGGPEQLVYEGQTMAAPLQIGIFDVTITIPNLPGEIVPYGVKAWGETEPEPPWGLALQTGQAVIY